MKWTLKGKRDLYRQRRGDRRVGHRDRTTAVKAWRPERV